MDTQEILLDQHLKNVRSKSYQINLSIEKNNLRQCLIDTNLLLLELKTRKLSPRNYYQLYTAIFDEMQTVQSFFKEELKRGRRTKDLYNSVQQAQNIVPRIYLMCSAASVCIEKEPNSVKEKLFDLLNMIKGVQNPTKGLFSRYYLLKTIKDKLPDKGNEYCNENSNINDTFNFILTNFEEMNNLWIRLSSKAENMDKDENIINEREKERKELETLVGENINRLSRMEGLDLDIYKNDVLPKILNIIIQSNDTMSQQYLLECIIQAFPDEYTISCLNNILDTIFKLEGKIDSKSLLITLMEKLSYSDKDFNNNDIKNSFKNISDILLDKINKIFDEQINSFSINENSLIDILRVAIAFLGFHIKIHINDINVINSILLSCLNAIKKYKDKLSNQIIKLIEKLLCKSLESECEFFQFTNFSDIMENLDFSSRKALSLKLINSLININSKDKVDTIDKLNFIMNSINSLIMPQSNEDTDSDAFDYEQTHVLKLLHVIHTNDPSVMNQFFIIFKNKFIEADNKRKVYTLPTLVNIIIKFCGKIAVLVDNKDSSNNIYNIDNITADNLYDFLLSNFKLINDILSVISENDQYLAFKLYLICSTQVNNIKTNKDKFTEGCISFINGAIQIYNDSKYELSLKIRMINEIVGTLISNNTLNNEGISQIAHSLVNSIQTMPKRRDQCYASVYMSNLYYKRLKDINKVNECISKAVRYANFSMTTPSNLDLFVIILNQIIYFIESDNDDIISADVVENIVEIINNHIITIKSEANNVDNLDEIESFFKISVQHFKNIINKLNRTNYLSIKL